MIWLRGVSKRFRHAGRETVVADRITSHFPTGASIALLGRNGAGKSSLLRLISGVIRPSGGRVVRRGSISWPVGFAGSFHPEMTGCQNTRFVARIYGVDPAGLQAFVQDLAGLGHPFHDPVRTYSSGMRARLAFALSMGIRFDTYLIDEVASVGDAAFRETCEAMLQSRLRQSGAIVVSHSLPMLRRLCSGGAVLENGRLEMFDDLDAAMARHRANLGLARPPGVAARARFG